MAAPSTGILCASCAIGALVPAAIVDDRGAQSFRRAGQVALRQIIRYSIAGSVLLTVVALVVSEPVRKMLAWVQVVRNRQLYGSKLALATIAFRPVTRHPGYTISSIGAGAIGATLLVLLYPRLIAGREIAGTDIAYAVPLTAIAALGHWWLGSINWALLVMLLLGSVPGITLGSLAARAVPEKILRGLLAATLTSVAYKLIF